MCTMKDARHERRSPKILANSSTSAAYAAASRGAFAEEATVGSKPTTESRCPEEPKAIISGQSQTESMAKFACRVTYEDLTPERRERLKVSILDSLGLRHHCHRSTADGGVLGSGKGVRRPERSLHAHWRRQSQRVYAALYNTALVRYIDFMDSYLAGAELCHPSDNTGAVLAACEHAGRSGKEFLTALAVAYQVQSTLTSSVPFMERGFDLTTALTYSLGAGVAKALAPGRGKDSCGYRNLRSNRISVACRTNHSDLAMEGPVLVPSGFRVRQRGLPGIAGSYRPEVCD